MPEDVSPRAFGGSRNGNDVPGVIYTLDKIISCKSFSIKPPNISWEEKNRRELG